MHLLYVPTLYCNLGCSYCYLGSQTDTGHLPKENKQALDTLEYAVNKFTKAGVLPFNVSLHGGEVTVLKEETLAQLFQFILDYYNNYRSELEKFGFKKDTPHIKTNLFNFHKFADLFEKYQVSISASIDLPLLLHEKYRTNKMGKSTLERTLENLRLLANYPHRKKFSSVICQEHYEKMDEIIEDIWRIHKDIGFDMNNYNFMFGFESELNDEKFQGEYETELETLDGEKQVAFYNKMKETFGGTELEQGLNTKWFEEFTPAFCTNSVNCGEKFFLLQGDGEIYSCVRGQGVEAFHYGNIFKDSVEEILDNAVNKIQKIHNDLGLDEDCKGCSHLNTCNTGCPFVKYEQQNAKSYTCEVQQELYKDFPELSIMAENEKEQKEGLRELLTDNHPQAMFNYKPDDRSLVLPNDLKEEKNALVSIIEQDNILATLYSNTAIQLEVDGEFYPLESQVLKVKREVLFIYSDSQIRLHIHKDFFDVNAKELIRNTLCLMMLRDTKVVYGDEQRTKQEHTFTHQVFYNLLEQKEDKMIVDVTPLLKMYESTFLEGVLNNFFITTNDLRNYHYQKQKENAFYHIQAINLPFQNIEFYWIK
ncbi:MAG: radical SAM protein [Cytophagales bacterium]|nr:radical SAM protein [Cytophagales bacterium]